MCRDRSNVPYWGKVRRGKVTKFWPGDENFLRRKFSPTKKFPRRIGGKVTKVYQRKIFKELLSNTKDIEVVVIDDE